MWTLFRSLSRRFSEPCRVLDWGRGLRSGKPRPLKEGCSPLIPDKSAEGKRDYAVFMGSLTALLIVALLAIFLAAAWPVLAVVVGIRALIKVLGLLFFV